MVGRYRNKIHLSNPVIFNLGSAEPRGSAKRVLGSAKYLKKIIHTTFHRSDILGKNEQKRLNKKSLG
jgi:hypothetical protein